MDAKDQRLDTKDVIATLTALNDKLEEGIVQVKSIINRRKL